MARHGAEVVRDEETACTGCFVQHHKVIETMQPGIVSRLEINRWFVTAQRAHNVVIKVSVGLKADFHDCVDDGLLVVAWCCCLKAISF